MLDFGIAFKVERNSSDINKLKSDINSIQSSLKNLEKSSDNTTKSVNALHESFKNLTKAAAAFLSINFIGGGLVALGSDALKTASEFEKFSAILLTLEGSSSKAESSMQWIKDFAKTTPYEVSELTDAFIKLKAYGIDPTNGMMKAIGDSAAAMGKDLIQGVEAVADAMNLENERLKEAFNIKGSIQGNKVIYQYMTTQGKQMFVEVDKNNKAMIQSTLMAIMNERYAGAMDQRAKTFEGMVSNMKDTYAQWQDQLLKDTGLFEQIKQAAGAFSAELTKMGSNKESMEGIASIVRGLITTFAYGIKAVNLFVYYFRVGFETIRTSIYAVWNGFSAMFADIQKGLVSAIKVAIQYNPVRSEEEKAAALKKLSGVYDIFAKKSDIYKKANQNLGADLVKFQQNAEAGANSVNKLADAMIKVFSSENAKAIKEAAKNTKEIVITSKSKASGAKEGAYKAPSKGEKTAAQKEYEAELKKLAKDYEDTVNKMQNISLDAMEFNFYKKLGDDMVKLINSGKVSTDKLMLYYEGKVKDFEAQKKEIVDKNSQIELDSVKTYFDAIYQSSKDEEDLRASMYVDLAKKEKEWQDLKLTSLQIEEMRKAEVEKIENDIFALKKQKTDESQLYSMNLAKEYFNSLYENSKDIADFETNVYLKLADEEKRLADLKFSNDEIELIMIEKRKAAEKEVLEEKTRIEKEETNKILENTKGYLDTMYKATKDLKYLETSLYTELEQEERKWAEAGYDSLLIEEMKKAKIQEIGETMKTQRLEQEKALQTFAAGFSVFSQELEVKLTSYADMTKSTLGGIQGELTTAFTTFFDYTKSGFMDLGDLAGNVLKGILEQIQKMVIEMLAAQAMQIAMNAASGGFGGFFANGGAFVNGAQAFAKGGAFAGGVQKFATGGTFTNSIVASPTTFDMGLMGEAGPEAIMPLTRDSSGKLGVQASVAPVNVQIINNSSAVVSARQTENGTTITIDEVISTLSKELRNGNGKFNDALNGAYEVKRRR